VLALLVLAFPLSPAAAVSYSGSPDLAKIDAFVSAEMQASHIPGLSLGVVHDDQVMHLRGFGTADQSGCAVTPQTPFVIGSLTKSFTALAVLQLVEAGKLELDAPVQRYLPWFHLADPTASARITVRQLLNQTSGLPDMMPADNALDGRSLEQFVRGLSAITPDRPVGSSFEYANANYAALGLIVQTVSGEAYGSYIVLQRRAINPAPVIPTASSPGLT
jgi:CubicO group peptidase (beta-lactamase class C family)